MGNIVLLDELTINKIAAGEVIERPASVIKEMIENSIDAKATNITVEIKNGGISYIKITDNGKGIQKDDLEMAFERHATSKIRCAEDLEVVKTMGFRGEALASIAAISNVELISKTADQETGYKVVVEGGRVLEKQEIGCQTGTTITVNNLFFNTPVRYKFLKKDYTETGYIEDVVTRIALVNPEISFKLINTGKTILQTSGNGDLKSTIYSIYGKDTAQGIIEVNYNYEDMKISGVIGKPEIARSNRSNQLFFVNKRHIKDKILTAATEQAYKGMIEPGKFGFVVLNIEMPQNKVDVNVHPAKLEVRFAEESKVFQAIFHAIKDSIAKDTALSDTSTKVDNIIIQSSNKNTGFDNSKFNNTPTNEKHKSMGLFGWKKNKVNEFNTNESNIVEDLYNIKKVNEDVMPKAIENASKTETVNQILEEDVVNTSDVLRELKQINQNVQNDLKEEINKKEIKHEEVKEEQNQVETPKIAQSNNEVKIENNNLPDGTTYTYVGENKAKIEDLLRQLHPETYKTIERENVAEEKQEYNFNQNEEVIEPETVKEEIQENTEPEIAQDNLEIINEDKQETSEPIENNSTETMNLEKTQEIKIAEPEEAEQMTQKFEIIKDNTQETEETSSEFNQMYEKLFGTPVIKKETEEKHADNINAVDIIKDNVSVFDGIEKYQRPTYKLIGVTFNTYIIAEIEKEMYIINQRTAREKVMYEKLKNNYYNQVNKDSQMLLLPDVIKLSYKEIEVIKENYDILTKAGFSFEEFGENTIKLTGVPTACLDLDTKELFVEILDKINTVARTSKQEKEEKFIATIASQIAQKTNNAVSIQEINSLMDELLSLQDPFAYDYDKPIAIKMTKYDIERKFSRK